MQFLASMNGSYPILVAEDDETDAEMVRLALSKAAIKNPTHIVRDGTEVLQYLKAEGPYAERAGYPFPRFLVLDLKMPMMDGFEVLQWLREHEECSLMPVVVMSASNRPEDVKRAYQLGANSFIQKPAAFENLVRAFGLLSEYWQLCEIPHIGQKCE